uniref:Secreted protein n=1 Tax=Globodera rostochiensis TaxID=31243 RepID=A0A914HLW1_GLORO
MMANMCLRMLCPFLMLLTAFFSLVPARGNRNHQNTNSPTGAYDSNGLIQGSGYEGFSEEDMRDINGGHDDGNVQPIASTSNPQTGLSSIPEATDDNGFQTSPGAFYDNQDDPIQQNRSEDADIERVKEESKREQDLFIQRKEAEDIQKALAESKKDRPTYSNDDEYNAALNMAVEQSILEYLRKNKQANGNRG